MKHPRALTLSVFLSLSVPAHAIDTPVVPAALIENAANGTERQIADVRQPLDSDRFGKSRQTLVVKPGVNELIPVSLRHINRVVTPFARPAIRTASSAETKVEANVIYVVPDDETPITMFVTEKGDPSISMSLTLVPRKIPPIEIALSFDDESALRPAYTGQAAEWERGQPYVQTLVALLRGVALQQIPPGYAFGALRPGDYLPVCRQGGFEFSFAKGQVLRGHHFNVAIGTVTNTSDIALEVVETSCADWPVVAVAAYPSVVLEPGETAEVYVAHKTPDVAKPRVRPSLVYTETMDAN